MSSPLSDAVDPASIRRVLVTKLRHHGDVLLASPVFTTLAHAAPHAEIDALVYRETLPMLAHHPSIARIHTVDRRWKKQGVFAQLAAERELLSGLRARHYDLLVHLTEHPRGLALAWLLRPRHAVTRERGTRRLRALWRRGFTHFFALPARTERHVVEQNLDALRRIGVQPLAGDLPLVLRPGDDAVAAIDAKLALHGVAARGFIHVHPGSRWLFKCWPPASMAALLDRLALDGHRLVITGAPDAAEQALVNATLGATRPQTRAAIVDLTASLDLAELAALTARARLFIGVDSAPMHIASAMQTPCVAIFGPSGEIAWGPWQVPHRIVASVVHPCRPCGLDGCGGGKVSDCLTTLPVDAVRAAVVDLLAATRGST